MNTVSLGQLVSIKTGKLDANAAVENGRYPFFTCAKDCSYIDTYAFDADALLVAGNGDLNVKHYSGKFNAYQRTYVLELLDSERLHMPYLYQFMQKYVERLRQLSIGGVIKYIKLGMLTDAQIPLPSLEEQKRIAAILDKADAIRSKRKHAITLADQLLRSVFLDMFGDPVTNPKGWKKLPLEAVVNRVIDCPHSTPRWTTSGKIAIRTSNLTKGGWSWLDKRFVTPSEFRERSKRAYVTSGDIVLSREGTVGVAAIVEEGMEICLGQRLVQLCPNRSKANSEFILHVLLWELEPSRIGRVMAGSTSKHLNVRELRALLFPVPPIELQQKFATICKKVVEGKTKMLEEETILQDFFNTLGQHAFKGELTKNNAA